MERKYNFLGNEFSLNEVAQASDKVLQNMINGYADMHSVYRDAMETLIIKKDAEKDDATKFALEMFTQLGIVIGSQIELYSAKVDEIIDNNDFQEMLNEVEETMDSYDRTIEGLDVTLNDMVEVDADTRVKYEVLKQQRELMNCMIRNLKKEKDFINDYARDYSLDDERE